LTIFRAAIGIEGIQMTRWFLFEFMDLAWIPGSLRATIHDTLESCLRPSPRRYYEWVAREILSIIERSPAEALVELGAGTAPITCELAEAIQGRRDISLRVSDLYPNLALYQTLEEKFPGVVQADRRPVDFSRSVDFPAGSLLVLSATFHHIPPEARLQVLKTLAPYRVAIFEPLRPNLASLLLSLLGFFAGLTTPVRFWNQRPGNGRRILWCWLLPLAPAIIVWDGLVSCLRCWSEKEWKEHLAKAIGDQRPAQVKSKLVTQAVVW
jgi:hypothetical protein